MIIKSIQVGDSFIQENGNRVNVTGISCAFDEQEKRWETSITYDMIHGKFSGLNTTDVTTKARNFVQMIQETDSGFVTQLHAPANNESPAETISFTPGAGSAIHGNGTAAVTTPVTSPANARSEMEMEFVANASQYGLQASDLGRRIRLSKNSRRRYKIVGAKPRNWKHPILVEGPRGGVYKISVDRAKVGLTL